MMQINLLNPNPNLHRNRKEGRVSLISLVVLASTFVSLAGWYIFLQFEIEEVGILSSKLREENLELSRIEALITRNQEDLQELERKRAFLEKSCQKRSAPIEVIDTVSDSLPEEPTLSLTLLALSERCLRLTGTSIDPEDAGDFISSLRSSALFESVELTRWERDRKAFRFEILGHLRE